MVIVSPGGSIGFVGPPGAHGATGPAGGGSTGLGDQRYRSFVERYVIARAPFFRVGHEKEDAWLATADAETVYKKIAGRSRVYQDEHEEI